MSQHNAQSTDCVLMVKPACFFSNPETAKTNEFQHSIAADVDGLKLAQAEFDAAVKTLSDLGVTVIAVDDTEEPQTPDAIFPNNWLTTHTDGTCVMYPMQPLSRRGERRLDVIKDLRTSYGKSVRHIVDWSGYEESEQYLEGTGSLVLDRANRVAYACLSARTHPVVLQQFCHHFEYELVSFDSTTASGTAIYHTNVMMCVGTGYAVVCLESVRDADERKQLSDSLGKHHEVIEITLDQVARFAGNMLEVRSNSGDLLLVMSSSAYDALTDTQRARLADHATLVQCDVSSIESASGGGIRCMLAEIFLP
ncbi:MAG: citrulline utilization hydrolase CtlX [Gammaproteobacteria bacterium]